MKEKPAGGILLKPTTGRGLAVLVLVGVALMVLSRGAQEPTQMVSGNMVPPPPDTHVGREEQLARELREVLAQIEGVGEIAVYVTLASSEQLVVAEEVNIQKGQNGEGHESRRPITLRDDLARVEKPMVLVEYKPTVKGVVVVARGATSPTVRYQLMRATQTALDLPANKVAVFPMRSQSSPGGARL